MSESPDLISFYVSIGRLVHHWGWLEAIIDFIILVIYEDYDGAQIEPEMPRSLARKLALIQKAAKSPQLEPYRHFLTKWPNRVREASDFRHDIIHGFYISSTDEVFHGVRLKRNSQSFGTMPFFASCELINEESEKILQLVSDGNHYSKKLAGVRESLPKSS